MREILQNKTADERRILEQTAELRGWEFVEEFEELILAQARLVGELGAQPPGDGKDLPDLDGWASRQDADDEGPEEEVDGDRWSIPNPNDRKGPDYDSSQDADSDASTSLTVPSPESVRILAVNGYRYLLIRADEESPGVLADGRVLDAGSEPPRLYRWNWVGSILKFSPGWEPYDGPDITGLLLTDAIAVGPTREQIQGDE